MSTRIPGSGCPGIGLLCLFLAAGLACGHDPRSVRGGWDTSGGSDDGDLDAGARSDAAAIEAAAPARTWAPPERQSLLPRATAQICLADGIIPDTVSETRCYTDTARQIPGPDLIPYDVASPLWTDGAIKVRFLVVPPGTRIAISEDGVWEFPVGSVIVKEFRLRLTVGDPASDRPVETRFMIRREGVWEFASYEWNADASEATRVGKAHFAPYVIQGLDGTRTVLDYGYPSPGDCSVCHADRLTNAFGPSSIQISKLVSYSGVVKNQLQALDEIGLFGAPGPSAPVRGMVDPGDESAPLEDRARSWLHANCSHCHQPNGWEPPGMTMDMRFDIPLNAAEICDVDTQYLTRLPRIDPGNPAGSAIWRRITSKGFERMPPFGTTRADPGADVVARWIKSLSGCPPRPVDRPIF